MVGKLIGAALGGIMMGGVMIAGVAMAQGPFPRNPSADAFAGAPSDGVGSSTITSNGPATVTGHLGSMATTTTPGSATQGLLMNNGNGTSTLIGPDGHEEVVASPE
jgi:hypothetical protein